MKTGILGGTFDPIHIGHLILAETVREQAGLDRIILMPAKISPFKQDRETASARDRAAMARIAAEGNENMSVSDLEIELGGISYTINTLHRIKMLICDEGDELYFICGGDSLATIHTWHDAEKLLEEFPIIAAARPGTDMQDLTSQAEKLRKNFSAHVTIVQMPQIDISSTDIRKRCETGRSIKYLVPAEVEDYIKENLLYSSLVDRLEAYIKLHLKPKRYNHTMRVVKECTALAEKYGADPEKARIAALFHDACKYWSYEDSVEIAEHEGVREILEERPKVIHGYLSAYVLQHQFNVNDEEILSAIRCHSTGKSGMTLLDKILFAADTTEPGRTYEDAARLNKLCYEDLDRACMEILTWIVDDLKEDGEDAGQDTLAALSEMKALCEGRDKEGK